MFGHLSLLFIPFILPPPNIPYFSSLLDVFGHFSLLIKWRTIPAPTPTVLKEYVCKHALYREMFISINLKLWRLIRVVYKSMLNFHMMPDSGSQLHCTLYTFIVLCKIMYSNMLHFVHSLKISPLSTAALPCLRIRAVFPTFIIDGNFLSAGDPIRRNGGMMERHGGMAEWRNDGIF